jgi:hypothetical protein
LDAIGDAIGNVLNEPSGAVAITPAYEMRNNELGISLNRGPGPSVGGAIDRAFHLGDVLLLRRREAPNFVHLNALRFNVSDLGVMEASAKPTRVNKELRNRVDAHVREARHAPHRSALAEH